MIKAANDAQAIGAWIEARARSSATTESYRKEIERLQAWCLNERAIALSRMGVDDCAGYRRWLTELGALTPQAWSAKWNVPQDDWVMASKRPRSHEAWRPFYRPPPSQRRHGRGGRAAAVEPVLTQASVDQAVRVVRSCFGFLRKVGYLRQNPWEAVAKERGKQTEPNVAERSLGVDDVAELWETVHTLPGEPEDAAEMMLVLELGLCCGLRISEILRLKVGSVALTSTGKYQLEFVGKGNVPGTVPLPRPVLQALEVVLARRGVVLGRDRDALLFPSQRRPGQPLSRAYAHSRLKPIFELTAKRISMHGTTESRLRAARLHQASAHWLRHTLARTAISDGRPLNHVQKLLRHSSIAVTSRYVVAPDEEVAQTAEASAATLSGGRTALRGTNEALKRTRS